MADYTPTQGRYLAYIHAYINQYGCPPAESDIAAAMCVSPPSVNMMVKTLEKKGLILRHPGQARSIQILVPEDEIPPWGNKQSKRPASVSQTTRKKAILAAPPANLYVLSVWLMSGPVGEKFANKPVRRVIEIRGDQTLEQLHETIFEAFDRYDEHLYEFQFGKKPYDPKGPNYGVPDAFGEKPTRHYASKAKLDDLGLKKDRVFGYWFDFGDDWYHQVEVERIETAIPTVTYPRIIKRLGKSPPQYLEEE